MTIEQRLVARYGVTDDPCLASWMLRDGTLVNGSFCGLQRDVDHHQIGEFYSRSKREDPGSSAIYVLKFMRRGNIRYGCSPDAFCVEHCGAPSVEQFKKIREHMTLALESGIQTCIGRRDRRTTQVVRYETWLEWLKYVRSYLGGTLPWRDVAIPDGYGDWIQDPLYDR